MAELSAIETAIAKFMVTLLGSLEKFYPEYVWSSNISNGILYVYKDDLCFELVGNLRSVVTCEQAKILFINSILVTVGEQIKGELRETDRDKVEGPKSEVPPWECPDCGIDLEDGICPNCGMEFDEDE